MRGGHTCYICRLFGVACCNQSIIDLGNDRKFSLIQQGKGDLQRRGALMPQLCSAGPMSREDPHSIAIALAGCSWDLLQKDLKCMQKLFC